MYVFLNPFAYAVLFIAGEITQRNKHTPGRFEGQTCNEFGTSENWLKQTYVRQLAKGDANVVGACPNYS